MRFRLDQVFRRGQPARLSIYGHIRSHLPPVGPGLTEGGDTLPDEADLTGPIRSAPGVATASACITSVGVPVTPSPHQVFRLLARSATGSDRDLQALERSLRSVEPLPMIDALIERLPGSQLSPSRIERVGLRLATTSSSRNPVKIGIALIGVVVGPSHRDVLMTLGRHDEFTLYSAVALANTEPEPDAVLWELGKARQRVGKGPSGRAAQAHVKAGDPRLDPPRRVPEHRHGRVPRAHRRHDRSAWSPPSIATIRMTT